MKYALHGAGSLGRILSKMYGFPAYCEWLKNAKVDFGDSILDVGCGNGDFLLDLKEVGFTSLAGIDQYVDKDVIYKDGIKIYRSDLSDVSGSYDFVLLSHSFEHMPNPFEILQEIHRILRPGHYVLIRIPVSRSYAWRKYRTNLVALDAPRHLFLHSTESMTILAEQTEFSIENIIYDSTDFQFWASELYSRGISLSR